VSCCPFDDEFDQGAYLNGETLTALTRCLDVLSKARNAATREQMLDATRALLRQGQQAARRAPEWPPLQAPDAGHRPEFWWQHKFCVLADTRMEAYDTYRRATYDMIGQLVERDQLTVYVPHPGPEFDAADVYEDLRATDDYDLRRALSLLSPNHARAVLVRVLMTDATWPWTQHFLERTTCWSVLQTVDTGLTREQAKLLVEQADINANRHVSTLDQDERRRLARIVAADDAASADGGDRGKPT
jgi:hypothetical protein